MRTSLSPGLNRPHLQTVVASIIVLIGLGFIVHWQSRIVEPDGSASPSSKSTATQAFPAVEAAPEQTVVHDAAGAVLATLTQGARTVVMHGPSRTFAEPKHTNTTITTSDWIRLYPTAFTGTVDNVWLARMAAENTKHSTPDLIETAMQYIVGAPTITDATGRTIAGDAAYGPEQFDDGRQEGSDFNDYIGISYVFGSVTDKPDIAQLGSLDCSGFMRMVWGYRNGMPLELQPTGTAIPRRAYQILQSSPGVVVMPNTGRQITGFSSLQVGDIVFHDASTDDGNQIDHLGMYLGLDSQGHHRFISSRKTANGPTFGDTGGKSVLDGKGLYAKTFRAARRF
jgi:cell wall-associated NlpC family hydrolase